MESEALATLILNKLRAGIKVILMFLVTYLHVDILCQSLVVPMDILTKRF